MKVKIVLPVWGTEYINLFFGYTLPSYLAKNNLTEISKDNQVEVVIYTSRKDALEISEKLLITKLSSISTIRVKILNDRVLKDVYRAYGKAHKKELNIAVKNQEAVYFLNADILLSDQFFPETLDRIKNGSRVVQIACPRAILETTTQELDWKFVKRDNSIAIKSEELAQLWIRNIHPLMNYHLLPKKAGEDFHPSSLVWRTSKNSYYLRGFHLHPCLVFPKQKKIRKFGVTVDDGWVYQEFEREEIYIEPSTSKFFAIELSKKSNYYRAACKSDSGHLVNQYFASHKPLNFNNLRISIKIGEASKSAFLKSEIEANTKINQLILDYFEHLNMERRKYRSIFLFHVYRHIARFVARLKGYIPNGAYYALRKTHRRFLFRVFGYEASSD